jgi:hypothetical protein
MEYNKLIILVPVSDKQCEIRWYIPKTYNWWYVIHCNITSKYTIHVLSHGIYVTQRKIPQMTVTSPDEENPRAHLWCTLIKSNWRSTRSTSHGRHINYAATYAWLTCSPYILWNCGVVSFVTQLNFCYVLIVYTKSRLSGLKGFDSLLNTAMLRLFHKIVLLARDLMLMLMLRLLRTHVASFQGEKRVS